MSVMTAMGFFPFVQRRFVGKIFSLRGEAYQATNKTLHIKHSNNQFFKKIYLQFAFFSAGKSFPRETFRKGVNEIFETPVFSSRLGRIEGGLVRL